MSPKKKKKKKHHDDDDDDEDREFAERWDPDKGDTLEGTITRKEKVKGLESSDGDTFTGYFIEIEDEEGETYSILCGSVLKKKLFAKYDEGDEVSITYRGKGGKGKYAKQKYDVEGETADDDDDDDD